jgi:hypothetical protein
MNKKNKVSQELPLETMILHTLWLEIVENSGLVISIAGLTKALAVNSAVEILSGIGQKTDDKDKKKLIEHLIEEFKLAVNEEPLLQNGMQINKLGEVVKLATCIGCGCNDLHACPSGCSWLRLDREAGVGVCSECEGMVEKWDNGVRSCTGRKTGEGA